MKVDGKKLLKQIMFSTEEGNVIISSCIICFANARKYFENIFGRMTIKYFEKVVEFSLPSSFTKSSS